jgi:hypothetical protein
MTVLTPARDESGIWRILKPDGRYLPFRGTVFWTTDYRIAAAQAEASQMPKEYPYAAPPELQEPTRNKEHAREQRRISMTLQRSYAHERTALTRAIAMRYGIYWSSAKGFYLPRPQEGPL